MSTTLKSPQKRRELHPDVPPVNPSPIFQRGSARAHLGDFTLFGLSWGEEGVLGGRRKGGEPLGGTLGRELELLSLAVETSTLSDPPTSLHGGHYYQRTFYK